MKIVFCTIIFFTILSLHASDTPPGVTVNEPLSSPRRAESPRGGMAPRKNSNPIARIKENEFGNPELTKQENFGVFFEQRRSKRLQGTGSADK